MSKDFGSEEFEWPEVTELRPSDAARLLYDVESAAAAANKRADILRSRKNEAKQIALTVAEIYEQPDISAITDDGRKVRYTPYPFDVFSVDDPAAFKEWAVSQSESFYDETPRLREEIFRDEMRRRDQDGEPLPPGVRKWSDTRLSRSAAKT